MAPASEPRRSSRARGAVPQSQNPAFNPAGRIERAGRLLGKTTATTITTTTTTTAAATKSSTSSSSAKSTPSASLLSEPLDYMEDNTLPRRRKRAVSDEPTSQNLAKVFATTSASGRDWEHGVQEDIQEEDDTVRCICGSDDYPGLPQFDDDARLGKDAADAEFYAAIELTEDVTGFFLQCDTCKAWQHGACVGIITPESSPEEYFCEQCRKDLHKIHAATNGQHYSHYLPLHQPLCTASASRAESVVKDGNRSPKSNGSKTARSSNATTQSTKRRSTMNSRDAAYDEEQLRRAIEASKEDIHETADSTSKRTKRGRSNSEENNASVKRQRTSSASVSPNTEKAESAIKDDSDEGDDRNENFKRSRNGRSQRERAEREDKNRRQVDTSAKRKARPERKELEDSERSDETPPALRTATTKSVEPPPAAEPSPQPQDRPDTPPTKPAPTAASNKKGSKSSQKKAKGRNQYTKDRDRDVELEGSPARSGSRDTKAVDEALAPPHSKAVANESKSHSKHKHASNNHAKFSMHDMKRRATAYLEFISRTQIELAAETTLSLRPPVNIDDRARQDPVPRIQANVSTDTAPKANGIARPNGSGAGKDFNSMNSREMMDVLTRRLVKWQDKYTD